MKTFNLFPIGLIFLFVLPLSAQVSNQDSIKRQRDYFPLRSSLGLELSHIFYLGDEKSRMEYGANFIASYSPKPASDLSGEALLKKTSTIYQLGAAAAFSRVGLGGDRTRWRLSVGLIYNQISLRKGRRGFGVASKVRAFSVFPPDGNLFSSNLYVQPEVGITFLSIANIYYGRNFTVTALPGLELPQNTVTLTFHLNPSLFKFGLQGM